MRDAHRAGLRTTATMMYGTVETVEERIEHLLRLRELQDETGGFTAFITWSYQPEHTELGGTEATGIDYLRTLAIARIVLDNFDNLQASWVTQGGKVGQLSLAYGANDMGSVMIEENVVRAAGAELLHGRSRDRPQHRERRLRRRSAATCTTRSSAIRSSASATCRGCSSWRSRARTATRSVPDELDDLSGAQRGGQAGRRARSPAVDPPPCTLPASASLAHGQPMSMITYRAAGSCRSTVGRSSAAAVDDRDGRIAACGGRRRRRRRGSRRRRVLPGSRQRAHAPRAVVDARDEVPPAAVDAGVGVDRCMALRRSGGARCRRSRSTRRSSRRGDRGHRASSATSPTPSRRYDAARSKAGSAASCSTS